MLLASSYHLGPVWPVLTGSVPVTGKSMSTRLRTMDYERPPSRRSTRDRCIYIFSRSSEVVWLLWGSRGTRVSAEGKVRLAGGAGESLTG